MARPRNTMSRKQSGIQIEGFNELLIKLNSDTLLAKPWGDLMRHLADVGKSKAKDRAPKLSGKVASGIGSKVDPKPVPLYAIVTGGDASRPSPRGPFRYGYSLNIGWRRPKGLGIASIGRKRAKEIKPTIIFHYRGKKKKTKGWFTGTLVSLRKLAKEAMPRVAKEIEATWGR